MTYKFLKEYEKRIKRIKKEYKKKQMRDKVVGLVVCEQGQRQRERDATMTTICI